MSTKTFFVNSLVAQCIEQCFIEFREGRNNWIKMGKLRELGWSQA